MTLPRIAAAVREAEVDVPAAPTPTAGWNYELRGLPSMHNAAADSTSASRLLSMLRIVAVPLT